MKWLPTFTKLFLLFVLGLILSVVGAIGFNMTLGNYTASSIFDLAKILGFVLTVLAPLLILLKFFMRLDSKA
ncbi:hypothetical protein [Hymenobacter yonginensis]|uniref:DUF2798 domain-containing protein n=1 Tax=Hymenobacter yonginensis TaxID=748197 RepID=A0ABY7PQZ6_9BACT|nr:hypothetical protein [Hymenobacter yonginensis]WBO85163.1 hypothetical protein O9Z63_02735 [Hymenobacter yonginensis]